MQNQNTSTLSACSDAVSNDGLVAQAQALALVPAQLARRYIALPLRYEATANTLSIALQSAHDVPVLDALSSAITVKPQLITLP